MSDPRKPEDYKHVLSWGRYMGSSPHYIEQMQAKACDDAAPLEAYSYDDYDGRWRLVDEITNVAARKYMKLPELRKPRPTNIPLTVAIPYKAVETMLNSAFGNQGIHYWCKLTKNCPGDLVQHILDGNALEIKLLDVDELRQITLIGILEGLGVLATAGSPEFSAFMSEDLDGPGADSIIQYAVFGKLVYG